MEFRVTNESLISLPISSLASLRPRQRHTPATQPHVACSHACSLHSITQTHTRQHRQERTSNANALLSASSYLEAHHASRRV